VDLKLGQNEIVGLVGPNGAGKTTLLNMISGISAPTAGRFILRGGYHLSQGRPHMQKRNCKNIPDRRIISRAYRQRMYDDWCVIGSERKISMENAVNEAAQILDFVDFPKEKKIQPSKI